MKTFLNSVAIIAGICCVTICLWLSYDMLIGNDNNNGYEVGSGGKRFGFVYVGLALAVSIYLIHQFRVDKRRKGTRDRRTGKNK